MPWNHTQGKALRDCGQDELGLHHRKEVANALARSSSKREIGEARTGSDPFLGETFWVEDLRLLPKCWMTVGTILAHKDHAVGRNRVAANLIVGFGVTC